MSAWSTLIWYVRNELPVGAPDVERFSDTAVIFVSAGAWKRSRAPRPPVQVGSLASPTSRTPGALVLHEFTAEDLGDSVRAKPSALTGAPVGVWHRSPRTSLRSRPPAATMPP